jgi:hypothetical protein
MSMDGRADILLLQYLHFNHPWLSYSAKSQEGGAVFINVQQARFLLHNW